jgi:uncharacterized protein YndB with AHSA1/START domain/DNA-binding transcriptional ArsR family regulator
MFGVSGPIDDVFRALADPTRRRLLDRLRERNGQTLNELCAGLDMRRQSVTQHLQVLEAAHLVTAVHRGRKRLHYLNPVPLHEMQERWIERFERPRLRVMSEIKHQAEGDPVITIPTHVYVTYITSTADRVWQALVDADLTARYWGHSNVSTWEPGARWEHRRTDGSGIADVVGTVLESQPPHRLVLTFEAPDGAGEPSQVTFAIEPYADIVRLTVTHEGLTDPAEYEAAMLGWASVCANLKTLLETGDVMPQAPWDMHAALRDELMARNDPR